MPGEHFVVPPHWEWYILLYFFLAGISGGAFVIGTMLRLWGSPADAAASRLAFIVSFPLLLLCPILLTIDLGQPTRFWHMLVDVGSGTPVFKAYSPMSLGVWGLTLFGLFSFVMFLAAVGEGGYLRWRVLAGAGRLMGSALGKVFMVIGAIFGFFVAAYTGVLLAVSNQPVWSDTWTLGGLFLASGLSGAVATILLFSRGRRDAAVTDGKLMEADRYFIILELVLIALFLITLGGVVSKVLGGGWIILWLVVLIGTLVPLIAEWRPTMRRQLPPVVVPVLVLVGVLALRAVIIFSAQA
ncbi:MAG: polysulfide reductase [Chloroflexi bacterium]|nr:MAG: polysulfide reductase [Chloroflexota bacterium]